MKRYSTVRECPNTSECPNTTFLDLCAELNTMYDQTRLIIPQVSWRSYGYTGPDTLSESYGDWDEVKEHTSLDPAKVFVMVERCSGSAYSGDLVEVSNYHVMRDLVEADELVQGVDWLDYSGGHGTFGIAIRVGAMTESILEAIMSLSDYPLLDESDHSQREHDAQNEQWEQDYRQEFKRELSKVIAAEIEAQADELPEGTDYWPYVDWVKDEEWIDGLDERTIDHWAWELMELSNVYWQNEQGDGMYLDVERMAQSLTERIREGRDWAIGKQAELQQEVYRSVRRGWELAYWDGFKGIAG